MPEGELFFWNSSKILSGLSFDVFFRFIVPSTDVKYQALGELKRNRTVSGILMPAAPEGMPLSMSFFHKRS
eukprot:CAMPEP_0206512048 /NCGR_PEP_ID=MMETSP0324_2-20121206/60637_1 /ASSEMBLY_ACC=CAM_ASM_000836 /TAXON_ID=2866 /ORGANISM="Crypthecodinium cohnii, Strain Seligo" /LENGTH=70 /DNA_ID=CAMNT_0054003911 /DNA_START=74 /DNA_END=283 /DNA_ORIENTATION=-